MYFTPSVKRGAVFGAATGLLIAVIVPIIPAVGLSIGVFELAAFMIGGALLGVWASSMVGASVPSKLQRKFRDEIQAGHTLVVIDSDGRNDSSIIGGMSNLADRHLVWQSNTTDQKEAAL